jgi:hypothetical protein
MNQMPRILPVYKELAIESWPIDRPLDYPKNARTWSKSAIEKVGRSIKEFGSRQPNVCDKRDVIVICHLRRAGARWAGLTHVPVHVAWDLTPTQIKALRLADNRTAQEAEWNLELLAPELAEFKELAIESWPIDRPIDYPNNARTWSKKAVERPAMRSSTALRSR